MNGKLVYKIFTRAQWEGALATGTFKGAPVDLADGFIHFSTAEQVEETVAKHFHGQKDLLLVCFDGKQFGDKLKWEVSRGGDRFPHLYDVLNVNLAEKIIELQDLANGNHLFPESY